MNERICPKCGLPSGLKNTKTGSYCKKCHSAQVTAYLKRTKYSDVKKRHAKIQKVIREGKNKPCADCGVSYPWYVMDYDHVRGEKLFDLATAASRHMSLVLIEAEMAKCEVVCSNCHRERTQRKYVSTAI